MMHTRELAPRDLQTVERLGIALIEFYSSDNDTGEIKQQIEQLPSEEVYYRPFRFDINQDKSVLETFGITEVPSLLVVKGRQILGRKNSEFTREEIEKWAHFSTIMGF